MRDESNVLGGPGITSINGVPGTLGCLAMTLNDQRLVFLTSHHVLFGAGAGEQAPVRLTADGSLVARSRHGRCGTVRFDGTDVHVDCATAELKDQAVPRGWRLVEDDLASVPPLANGTEVVKNGAGTGITHGIVLDTNHSERIRIERRLLATSRQILVEPRVPGARFTGVGDSGAALCDETGAVRGLLWGADPRGYGLACPIAPVLYVLHIRLVRLVQEGAV